MKDKKNEPRPARSLATTLASTFFILSVVILLLNGGFSIFTNIRVHQQSISVQQQLGAQMLDVLDVQDNLTDGLKQEDVELLKALANQVAFALRDARSFTETQQRADREALIGSIGQKIQSATSVENALQVAVLELGRALGTQTSVRLKSVQGHEDQYPPFPAADRAS